MRIGLPRALSYYEYETLWCSFFGALGAQVLVSQPTCRSTIETATARASADLCLPAKVYAGHLLALVDEVDFVFVPSLRRPAPSTTHCAPIIALPDLARSLLGDSSKILAMELDLDKGRLALAQAVWAAGKQVTWNPIQIARAADAAWTRHQENPTHNSPGEAIPQLSEDIAARQEERTGQLTLGIVGHPYALHDEYVNLRLLQRLRSMDVRVLTPDALPDGAAEQAVREARSETYWAYAPSLTGAGACFLRSGAVDGLVAVISFGCAPDSGLAPELAGTARRKGVPTLTLTLDEHSGDAGLLTRLEAFVDMLERRQLRG